MKNSDEKRFPRLAEFARGYLHEDLITEYGSAVAAARAYVRDLSAKECVSLLKEIYELRAMGNVTKALNTLGSSWNPTDSASTDQVLAVLERTAKTHH